MMRATKKVLGTIGALPEEITVEEWSDGEVGILLPNDGVYISQKSVKELIRLLQLATQ